MQTDRCRGHNWTGTISLSSVEKEAGHAGLGQQQEAAVNNAQWRPRCRQVHPQCRFLIQSERGMTVGHRDTRTRAPSWLSPECSVTLQGITAAAWSMAGLCLLIHFPGSPWWRAGWNAGSLCRGRLFFPKQMNRFFLSFRATCCQDKGVQENKFLTEQMTVGHRDVGRVFWRRTSRLKRILSESDHPAKWRKSLFLSANKTNPAVFFFSSPPEAKQKIELT